MNLFTDFDPTTSEQWRAVVEKELKGLSFDEMLIFRDKVEGIEVSKFAENHPNISGKLSYSRTSKSTNNDWFVGKVIEVEDEKRANKIALKALNQGADSLTFCLLKKNISWEILFQEIGLDFIETQFKTLDDEQTENLKKYWGKFTKKPLVLLNDWMENRQNAWQEGEVSFSVNSFGVHQAGANAVQEIAMALAAGHSCLYQLLSKGENIDSASAMLRFEMGIGSNYFVEVAKFRVFRKLWANVVDVYQPKENCSHACFIYAKTGFVNKSLKDPYTNLLRQSTEAMSAVLGGVNELQVQAYDKYAKETDSALSERMALNISNILKEESYFNKVIDPLGGSYNLEQLSKTLEDKAWQLFQEIEKRGGIEREEAQNYLRTEINKTATIRKEQIASNEVNYIGINKFLNPDDESYEWKEIPSYFGLNALILEKTTNGKI